MAGRRGSIIDFSTGAMGALIDGNSGCNIVSACNTNVGTLGIIFSSLMMASFPTVESAADVSFEWLGGFVAAPGATVFWFLMYLRATLGRVSLRAVFINSTVLNGFMSNVTLPECITILVRGLMIL